MPARSSPAASTGRRRSTAGPGSTSSTPNTPSHQNSTTGPHRRMTEGQSDQEVPSPCPTSPAKTHSSRPPAAWSPSPTSAPSARTSTAPSTTSPSPPTPSRTWSPWSTPSPTATPSSSSSSRWPWASTTKRANLDQLRQQLPGRQVALGLLDHEILDESDYTCDECSATFPTIEDFYIHYGTAGSPPHYNGAVPLCQRPAADHPPLQHRHPQPGCYPPPTLDA